MARVKLPPGGFITRESYFAEYVDRVMKEHPNGERVQHLKDYGRGLLGSADAAEKIIDEWLEFRG